MSKRAKRIPIVTITTKGGTIAAINREELAYQTRDKLELVLCLSYVI